MWGAIFGGKAEEDAKKKAEQDAKKKAEEDAKKNAKELKLVAAVKKGDVEEAKRLVWEEDASLEYRDKESEGKTPREIAITMGHQPLIEFLSGVELRNAAYNGDVGAVETLLKSNANVNYKDGGGMSALHVASGNGQQSAVELLLNSNATINLQTHYGRTPLLFASRYGKAAVVEVLLARNADTTIKDSDGKTARDWAVKGKDDAVVQLLDDFQVIAAAEYYYSVHYTHRRESIQTPTTII